LNLRFAAQALNLDSEPEFEAAIQRIFIDRPGDCPVVT
jgi:hypothetical protein